MADRDSFINKIDNEAKALSNRHKVKQNNRMFSEYEVKWAVRNILYNMPITDEMMESIMKKDSILNDIYSYYQDIFFKNTINYLESDFKTIICEYLERKENVYLTKKLHDIICTEHNKFLEDVKHLPPVKIIDEAYSIVIRQDIVSSFKSPGQFSTERLKALLTFESPLWSIYNDWMKSDYGHMDDVQAVIENTADERAYEIDMERLEAYDDCNEAADEEGLEL